MHHVIGQKFFILTNEYQITVNPFLINADAKFDEFIKQNSHKILTTHNNDLLMNSGDILDNTIYVCMAQDVLKKIDNKTTSQIYYPFLAEHGIYSIHDLNINRQKLVENNKTIDNEHTKIDMQNIDLFHKLYHQRENELKYINYGIRYIKIRLKPEYIYNVPLDIIFKLIHASQECPLIKYNSASKQEKIYRLYADKDSIDGRKIPYLERAEIFKLQRTIGKTKAVSVFIKYKSYHIVCDFEDNGNIFISCDFGEIIKDISLIDSIFKESANNVINTIGTFLKQNGYTIKEFDSILRENIEIVQMKFQTIVKIHKNIVFDKIINCISSVFNVESKNLAKGIVMRFKRVSNFVNATSQEAFVIDQQKHGANMSEIKEGLIENFKMTEQAILTLFAKVAIEEQIIQDTGKRSSTIKQNPGFKTTLELFKEPGTMGGSPPLLITVDDITDIRYLDTLTVYIDTFIRLTQDMYTDTAALCSKHPMAATTTNNTTTIVPFFKDLISESDKPYLEQVTHDIIDNKLISSSISDDDDNPLFNFWDDDYEEDDDDASILGKGPTRKTVAIDEVLTIIKNSNSNSNSNSDGDGGENGIQDIDGMKIAHPTPFFKKMSALEPKLFLNTTKGKYKAYSRMCGSTDRKQPIMLTHSEKTKIDKEQPGFFNPEDVLQYGSDSKKNPYYYICPRYWCLKTNSPISPSDVEAGKCGKIIPRDAKKVPHGAYVYEFYDPKEHGSRENYIKHYPGFSTLKNTSEDGRCIPCCLKTFNQPKKMAIKQKCLLNEKLGKKISSQDDDNVEEGEEGEEGEEAEEGEEGEEGEGEDEYGGEDEEDYKQSMKNAYVIGPDKIHVAQYRRGYLQPSIQLFLGDKNTDCIYNKKTKVEKKCLLRFGVEASDNQSFISCIADASSVSLPTISNKDFKNKLIHSLTIDKYITYQNGNLYSAFMVGDYKNSNVVISQKYKNSSLFKHLDKSPEQLLYFKNVIASFENFQKYLQDDDIIIDYEYLWDIICEPNEDIFKQGANLVIMEIMDNDSTNNIQIICPTNIFSKQIYNPNKPSLFLIRNDNLYQPIYLFVSGKKDYIYKLIYGFDKKIVPPSITNILKTVIEPVMMHSCAISNTHVKEYTFKTPLLLGSLLDKLSASKYSVKTLVLNFLNKVIGVIAEKRENFYIPCYPSALIPEYDFVFINEDLPYKTYADTVSYLTKIAVSADIPCEPKFKVIEDEYVIGILTETNQFIQLSDPELATDIYDDLQEIDNVGFKDETNLQLKYGEHDSERVEYISKIRMETKFYNSFRNMIRILLNTNPIKERIENMIKNKDKLYHIKLDSIVAYLKDMTKGHVVFSSKIPDIGGEDMYSKKSLIIPKHNLITGDDNSLLYYTKMSDELLRYSRIQSFMLHPKSFLSFGNVNFDLRENEILVIESMLTTEYFDDLIPIKQNKYALKTGLDTANPFFNKMEKSFINHSFKPSQKSKECNTVTKLPIKSIFWKLKFPLEYMELTYECINGAVLHLLKQNITLPELKRELYREYFKFGPEYEKRITNTLVLEGKKIQGHQVLRGHMSFKMFITSPEYFITNFDIWILAIKYKIPLILISTKPILLTNYQSNYMVLYSPSSDSTIFSFISASALKPNESPSYKLIVDENENTQLSLSFISLKNTMTPKEYLDEFEYEPTTTYKKKTIKITNV